MSEQIERHLAELRQRLYAIEERNARVEAEKAWETSVCRKVTILLMTYVVMCLAFYSLGSTAPLANAVVPTMGFFLSTLTLPAVRRMWIGR